MGSKTNQLKLIKIIASSAIFGALAIILYCFPAFQFSLPFTPTFLKLHFDEIPIFIAGFAYGPIPASIIIVLKFLFKLITDIPETAGIGATADLIYSFAFILPAILIYTKKRNMKGLLIGLSVGLFSQLLFSCVIGLYTIFPLYGLYYGATSYNGAMEWIGSLFGAIDSSITTAADPKVIYEFLIPFNLIKNAVVIVATLLMYKPLKIFIDKNSNTNDVKEDDVEDKQI